MSYSVFEKDGNLHLHGLTHLSPKQTFECGQCFRFRCVDGIYEGVVGSSLLRVGNIDKDTVIFGCTLSDYEKKWKRYLSIDRDYPLLCTDFESNGDPILSAAASYGRGIRILRQDKWEALCSFIISQNNNIPRIKKIIEKLCRTYGERITGDGEHYSFPTAQRLASLSVDELYALSMGFRAKYVYDAAQKVSSGEIDLAYADTLSTKDAADYLCRIKGVGPKVALCTLLFGFDRTDAFPIDVWVKKVLAKYYPDGPCSALTGKNAGIAQQYLFYYERCLTMGEI